MMAKKPTARQVQVGRFDGEAEARTPVVIPGIIPRTNTRRVVSTCSKFQFLACEYLEYTHTGESFHRDIFIYTIKQYTHMYSLWCECTFSSTYTRYDRDVYQDH